MKSRFKARFEARKSAKPTGQKIRFDSSDEEGESSVGGENGQVEKKRVLFDSSDEEGDNEVNFASKIRPEFRSAEGGALFQKETEINDDRFKLDERFIDESVKNKVKTDGERKLKERRKREFQSVRHVPTEAASESERSESESEEDKNQFTNPNAPQVSTDTHFQGQLK